jgi:hypothetical protein
LRDPLTKIFLRPKSREILTLHLLKKVEDDSQLAQARLETKELTNEQR